MAAKKEAAPAAEEKTQGITLVDNTDAKAEPEREVQTEAYELVEGLKQVNYL